MKLKVRIVCHFSINIIVFRLIGPQSIRSFASHGEGWVFKSQQRKNKFVTRGPWATSISWETSSNQWIHISLAKLWLSIQIFKNWPSSSGENFWISWMYFCNFVIISQCKKVWPFHLNKLKSSSPRVLFAKFGWNWTSGSTEEDFLIFAIS